MGPLPLFSYVFRLCISRCIVASLSLYKEIWLLILTLQIKLSSVYILNLLLCRTKWIFFFVSQNVRVSNILDQNTHTHAHMNMHTQLHLSVSHCLSVYLSVCLSICMHARVYLEFKCMLVSYSSVSPCVCLHVFVSRIYICLSLFLRPWRSVNLSLLCLFYVSDGIRTYARTSILQAFCALSCVRQIPINRMWLIGICARTYTCTYACVSVLIRPSVYCLSFCMSVVAHRYLSVCVCLSIDITVCFAVSD